MEGKPKPMINLGASCFLNVGFQVLATLRSLKGLFDNEVLDDSELSLLKKELHKILYDEDTRSCKNFIDIWNGQIHDKIKVTEPTAEDRDPDSKVKTPLRTLVDLLVDPLKPGNPLLLLQDIFPRIWSQEEYPWYIQPLTYTEYLHLTDDFLLIKNEISLKNEDPFKRFIVIMIEASYEAEAAKKVHLLKEHLVYAPKSVELDFSKKLTMEPEFTEDGIELKYDLVSVIKRKRKGIGHYIAYVRRTRSNNSKQWYRTSDLEVTSVAYKKVESTRQPEILIYELVEDEAPNIN